MQATVGVFLRNRDHQPQIRLDHFLLCPGSLALATLNGLNNFAEFRDRQTDIVNDQPDLVLNFGNFISLGVCQLLPCLSGHGLAGPVGNTLATTPQLQHLLA